MATVLIDPPTYTATVNGANTYVLRQAGHGVVSRWIVDLRSAAFVGSITVKARMAGTANAFVPIPYVGRYLNGAVGSDVSGTGVVTGDSLLDIDSTGLELALDVTSYTSGSLSVTSRPVAG